MSSQLDEAIGSLRERAAEDPAVAEVVLHLAGPAVEDPYARPGDAVVGAARAVNRARQRSQDLELRDDALTTPQVVELLGSVSDRKGVDRRRKRGALLGYRVGRATLHPAWQFDRRRRDTRAGLREVLGALDVVAADAREIHALAVAPGAVIDGRSIAGLLADGEVEAAVQAALLAGDQS